MQGQRLTLARLENIREKVEAFKNRGFEGVSIDELKKDMQRIGNILTSASPVAIGTRVYRGRSFDPKCFPVNVSELGAPPPSLVHRHQRCNRVGDPMFYCCSKPSTIFHELRKRPGERIIYSEWQVTAPFETANIGYDSAVFARLGAQRACPGLLEERTFPLPEFFEAAAYINQVFAELFTIDVPEGQEWQYGVSIALSEFLMHRPEKRDAKAESLMLYAIQQCRAERIAIM